MSATGYTLMPKLPTVPGDYVVDRGAGQSLIVLHWSAESRAWRQGATQVRDVKAWHGPLPRTITRRTRPEQRNSTE